MLVDWDVTAGLMGGWGLSLEESKFGDCSTGAIGEDSGAKYWSGVCVVSGTLL